MAFNLPVQNYFRRVQGPTIWVRPADWPVITDTPSEVQFLISDQGDSNCSIRTQFTRTSGTQNIIIDWGDGTTNTISATATTTTPHTYIPGTGTPCSLGYTTFKIRVYFTGTGVSVLNTCAITPVYLAGNTFSHQTCYVLEAYFGNGTIPTTPTSFQSAPGNGTSLAIYGYLKYVKYPATVTWTNTQNIFVGATSLARVVLPTSMSSVSASNNMFQNCYELEEVTFPANATGLTSFTSIFQNCYNLQRVTLPTTLNSCTSFNNAFNACVNLRYLTLPSLNNCTDFTSAFASCTQLEWVKFTSMPTVTAAINFTTAFNSSFNLQNVYFPATGVSTNTYTFTQTFLNCQQLRSVIFPSNINGVVFLQTFGSCTSLIRCVFPTNMPSCVNMGSCFTSCYSLTDVTLPTINASTGMNFDQAFNSCFRLESITIPSTLLFTNMSGAFGNCSALKTINWSPGAQNFITNLSSTFSGCRNLTSITLPTSMTLLNTLSSTFSSCNTLESVTFPTSLNAVTTLSGAFLFCFNLKSITLPTSMTACNNFSQVFQGCFELRSVVFPNTVAANTTTFSGLFINGYALESVVFPGAAQLSLANTINAMFTNCSNLKTITNFDKIGSLTATPLLDAGGNTQSRFTSISFSAPLTRLDLNGTASVKTDVQSVRLLNTSAGQWTGGSPQINVSYTNMSTAQLVQLFNDMAAQGTVVLKTINITGAVGAAGLTPANRAIITSLGWTITG
jgi:hypothetical protein